MLPLVVTALLLLGAPAPAPAATTLTGEVIDVTCHAKDPGRTGAEHADCALSCARRGAVLGLLTPDGVFTITGPFTQQNNRQLIEFVARRVTATGTVGEQHGHRFVHVTAMALAR